VSGEVQTVELRGVSKVFGPVVALRATDLTFEAGQTTMLVGHNGAGKSTLLALLATLLRPTTGNVLFDGKPAARLGPALRRSIGFAAEQPLGYAELTGRENVMLQARAQHLDDGVAKADAILDALGLEPLADRVASGYSQGELRRLGLARALIHEPQLLLLDEPTSGLDLQGAARLVELIGERADSGANVIISTHDPWLGAAVGQRIVALQHGEVTDDGPAPTGDEGESGQRRKLSEWRRLLGAPE